METTGRSDFRAVGRPARHLDLKAGHDPRECAQKPEQSQPLGRVGGASISMPDTDSDRQPRQAQRSRPLPSSAQHTHRAPHQRENKASPQKHPSPVSSRERGAGLANHAHFVGAYPSSPNQGSREHGAQPGDQTNHRLRQEDSLALRTTAHSASISSQGNFTGEHITRSRSFTEAGGFALLVQVAALEYRDPSWPSCTGPHSPKDRGAWPQTSCASRWESKPYAR